MHDSLDFGLDDAERLPEEVDHAVGDPDDAEGEVLMLPQEIHPGNLFGDLGVSSPLWRFENCDELARLLLTPCRRSPK